MSDLLLTPRRELLRLAMPKAYHLDVDPIAPLYQQLDPLRPLAADETDLYVDWQNELDLRDVKTRLVNAIGRSSVATCRLFTGHRGAGKTTELNRVKQRLEAGTGGRRFFVSMLQAEQWVDLQDVQPEDVVFQIVRQLVNDLRAAGFGFAEEKFRNFYGRLRDLFKAEVKLDSVELGIDPFNLSFSLDKMPAARKELRRLLQGQLPGVYDLVNNEILKGARAWLAEPGHGGFEDVLIIVDQLDRIPRQILNGVTNHESLFLDNAGTLRALNCPVLYTIPIELAYSRCRNRLIDVYGSDILALPAIPVTDRSGLAFDPGLAILEDMVGRRATKAGLELDSLFEDGATMRRVLSRSGGHVRGLFALLRTFLDDVDELPIPAMEVQRSLAAAAAEAALPLRPADWALLDAVHETKQAVGEESETWNGLLMNRFVFAYQDEQGYWYDWNPLLELVRRPAGR